MPLTIRTQCRGSPIPMRVRDAPVLTIRWDSALRIRGSPGYMEPPMRRNRGPPSQADRLSWDGLSEIWKGANR